MSGIYIPGMEMPTRCGRCDFRIPAFDDGMFDHYECCITAAVIDNLGEKMVDCPLVPVPDHGRQDGLYSKYFVIKTETGEIVQDCFVLRPQKDKAAVAALLLYAKETENQELSSDIRGWLSTIIPAEEGDP